MALMGVATFSHMIPKYAVEYIDTEMVKQCVDKTLEKMSYAILGGKGLEVRINRA